MHGKQPWLVRVTTNNSPCATAVPVNSACAILQVFHCVHFEAPADQTVLVDQSQRSHDDIPSLPPVHAAVAIDNLHVLPLALVRRDSLAEQMDADESGGHEVVAMAVAPMLHLQGTGSANGHSRQSPELPDDACDGHDAAP